MIMRVDDTKLSVVHTIKVTLGDGSIFHISTLDIGLPTPKVPVGMPSPKLLRRESEILRSEVPSQNPYMDVMPTRSPIYVPPQTPKSPTDDQRSAVYAPPSIPNEGQREHQQVMTGAVYVPPPMPNEGHRGQQQGAAGVGEHGHSRPHSQEVLMGEADVAVHGVQASSPLGDRFVPQGWQAVPSQNRPGEWSYLHTLTGQKQRLHPALHPPAVGMDLTVASGARTTQPGGFEDSVWS